MRNILLTGGGSKVVATAAFCEISLSQSWFKKDLHYAGVSAGAALASALALDMTPARSKELAVRLVSRAFDTRSLLQQAADLPDTLLGGAFPAKYDPKVLEGELRRAFGHATIADARGRLSIFTLKQTPFGPAVERASGDRSVVDALLSAMAAPRYFPPHQDEVDAGLVMNVPAPFFFSGPCVVLDATSTLTASATTALGLVHAMVSASVSLWRRAHADAGSLYFGLVPDHLQALDLDDVSHIGELISYGHDLALKRGARRWARSL